LYLAGHHYRTAWSWDAADFARTDALRRTLHGAAQRVALSTGRPIDPAPYGPRFTSALDDDMNTPDAVRTCLDLADAILEAPSGVDVRPGQDVLRTLCRVLGLTLAEHDPDEPSGARWPELAGRPPDWETWSAQEAVP
jgi:cysteinyl-tRNA synthetase